MQIYCKTAGTVRAIGVSSFPPARYAAPANLRERRPTGRERQMGCIA